MRTARRSIINAQFMRHLYALPLLFFALTFAGCEGAEGPAGALGPQGSPGPTGPQGPPGNANVQVVDRSATLGVNGGFADATIGVSEITERVLDRGVVIPYLQTGTNTWTPLPWSYLVSGGCFVAFNPAIYPGNIQIVYQNDCGGNDNISLTLRLVIIDGPSGFLQGEEPPAYSELQSQLGILAD